MAIERNIVQIPALVDLHVHFREPGFRIKKLSVQVAWLPLRRATAQYSLCQI